MIQEVHESYFHILSFSFKKKERDRYVYIPTRIDMAGSADDALGIEPLAVETELTSENNTN